MPEWTALGAVASDVQVGPQIFAATGDDTEVRGVLSVANLTSRTCNESETVDRDSFLQVVAVKVHRRFGMLFHLTGNQHSNGDTVIVAAGDRRTLRHR